MKKQNFSYAKILAAAIATTGLLAIGNSTNTYAAIATAGTFETLKNAMNTQIGSSEDSKDDIINYNSAVLKLEDDLTISRLVHFQDLMSTTIDLNGHELKLSCREYHGANNIIGYGSIRFSSNKTIIKGKGKITQESCDYRNGFFAAGGAIMNQSNGKTDEGSVSFELDPSAVVTSYGNFISASATEHVAFKSGTYEAYPAKSYSEKAGDMDSFVSSSWYDSDTDFYGGTFNLHGTPLIRTVSTSSNSSARYHIRFFGGTYNEIGDTATGSMITTGQNVYGSTQISIFGGTFNAKNVSRALIGIESENGMVGSYTAYQINKDNTSSVYIDGATINAPYIFEEGADQPERFTQLCESRKNIEQFKDKVDTGYFDDCEHRITIKSGVFNTSKALFTDDDAAQDTPAALIQGEPTSIFTDQTVTPSTGYIKVPTNIDNDGDGKGDILVVSGKSIKNDTGKGIEVQIDKTKDSPKPPMTGFGKIDPSKLPGVWSSDDEKVATVDQNGKVTGKKSGTTTIRYRVSDADGKTIYEFSYKLTVFGNPGTLDDIAPMAALALISASTLALLAAKSFKRR